MGLVVSLFTHITNPLAVLSCFTVGVIAPAVGAALIGVGKSLFEGIFGGLAKKQADKRAWDMFMKRMKLIKPKGKYSRGIDPVTARAIEHMFKQRGMQAPEYTETQEGY